MPSWRTAGAIKARLAATVVFCVVLAGCWWQQPGGTAEHTRHMEFEATLTPDSVAALTEQWSVDVDDPVVPVTSADMVYLTYNSASPRERVVEALDIASGSTVWQQNLPEAVGTNALSAAVVGDEVWVSHLARLPYSNSPCSDLTRLDAATGDVIAATEMKLPTTSFVVSGPYVAYIQSDRCDLDIGPNAHLVLRDVNTLDVLWTAELSQSEIDDEPIISADRVYAGGLAFYVSGCGADVCDPLPVKADPDMANRGRLYTVTNTSIHEPPPNEVVIDFGAVEVDDATTGDELWRAPWGDDQIVDPDGRRGRVGSIAVADEDMFATGWLEDYTGAIEGMLAAYPAAGCGQPVCEPVWTAPGPSDAVRLAVAGDVAYSLGSGVLTAYDARGCGAPTCTPLVTIPTDAETLILSAGRVFLIGTDGGTTMTAVGLP